MEISIFFKDGKYWAEIEVAEGHATPTFVEPLDVSGSHIHFAHRQELSDSSLIEWQFGGTITARGLVPDKGSAYPELMKRKPIKR